MMKTGKSALNVAKASGSSVESSLAYPNSSLKVSACPQSTQMKSKFNRFKIATSILKLGSSTAAPRPPEASNGLPNGFMSLVSDESSGEMSSQRRSNSKDVSDFGLFQKHQRGNKEASSSAAESSREMYSLSEEAGECGDSDLEEHIAGEKSERKLLGTKKKEEVEEIKEESNSKKCLDQCEERETEERDKDLTCTDSVADECMSGSYKDDA